ncbi:glycosyltransferase family 4 protein [Providencia sp. PROV114]|uniref:glycosyltransferase family 4 protein n=1 Tax=Providencia sp. PROV114 TaxID=2949825 RepID=UPI00234B46EF|nr:glycosyltransferase family 4 protein [Providencia sp. PROV114]WOB82041.1 glycosyltransferase family 4 protein [Providencia sp. PROV114]
MKKIAHIQLLPILSGAQRVTLDELQRLSNDEYIKYLICNGEGPLTNEARKLGIIVIIVKSLKREISPYHDLISLYSLFKIIKKENFDIVHTHSSKTGVIGRLASFFSKVPLIVHTVHGFSFPSAKNKIQLLLYYLMERLGSLCGDILICLHEEDKKISINTLKQPESSVYVIPNGVDIKKFNPLCDEKKKLLRQIFKYRDTDILIGMTGRLWEQKNPLFLFNSLIDTLKLNNHIKLIFIGDGELSNVLKKQIQSHHLENQVILMGWCNNTETILNTLDIFVLPSKWEGMPLAILEAQSTGLPCVVSNISGNRALVTEGNDGFLFELDNKPSLNAAVNQLIHNKELRIELGKHAREKIMSQYSIDKRIEKIDSIYKRLLP